MFILVKRMPPVENDLTGENNPHNFPALFFDIIRY